MRPRPATFRLRRWSTLILLLGLVVACQDETRELPLGPEDGSEETPRVSYSAGETTIIYGVEITDLGAFNGGWSEAYGINGAGQIVGTSNSMAFMWDPSTRVMTPIANPWNDWNIAWDINSSGQAAGGQAYVAWWWDRQSGAHAVNGPAHDIGFSTGSPTGLVCKSGAYGINDDGDIVGGEDNCQGAQGFIWTKATNSYNRVAGSAHASKVNNHGRVIGGFHNGRAFFTDLAAQNVVTIPSLGGATSADDLNEAGQVVGGSVGSDGRVHAYLWNAGDASLRDLGTLGGTESRALGINEMGQVVGWSTDGTGVRRAFFWNPSTGAMKDLGLPPGANAAVAYDINDAGQVGGYADYGTTPLAGGLIPPNSSQVNHRATRWVLDLNHPPSANPGGPYSNLPGSEITFDGTTSTDPEDGSLTFRWDFGDGSTGAGATVQHTYAEHGAYTVTLTVTDPGGKSDTKTTTAAVTSLSHMSTTCRHAATGIAFDGTYYFVAEGHDGGPYCITRYSAEGIRVDYKLFAFEPRGFHFVDGIKRLVGRRYNGPFFVVHYGSGTIEQLTQSNPENGVTGGDQHQLAADPDGTTYWRIDPTASTIERRKLSDDVLVNKFPVSDGAGVPAVAVTEKWVFVQTATGVNTYDKAGAAAGSYATAEAPGCRGYGFGASGAGDQVQIMYQPACARVRAEVINIRAPNRPPMAQPGGPYANNPGVPITFDGSRSSDPENGTLTFDWNFGDGSTGSGPTPGHAYANPGSYTVKLTVTDPAGGVDTRTTNAEITSLQALTPACGHKITGIAFDGTYFYVGEGHDGLNQCITRYSASGVRLDHKVFPVDIRGLHYVRATSRLVARTWGGPLFEIDYGAGTHRQLTPYAILSGVPGAEQNQPAADPDGRTYWLQAGGNIERHQLSDNAVLTRFPVTGMAGIAAVAVTEKWVFVRTSSGVNAYDKEAGKPAGSYPTHGLAACDGYGFGAFGSGDQVQVMFDHDCWSAQVDPPITVDPGTTAAGTDVESAPVDEGTGDQPVELTFAKVALAGKTTLEITKGGPTISPAYKFETEPVYYAIKTTASYSGLIRVCIDSEGALTDPARTTMLHGSVDQSTGDVEWEEPADQSVTAQADGSGFTACGNVTSLSPFVIVQRKLAQSITFGPMGTKYFGDSPAALVASSSSGLPVSFAVDPKGAQSCTVQGTTVTYTDVTAGPAAPCSIVATQQGNDTYAPAASVQRSFEVQYRYSGFFQPVDNPGAANLTNKAKAGSAIPVKFSLSGNWGLNIFAIGSPSASSYSCTSSPEDLIEETTAGTTSGLQYDAASGQYVYIWKTLPTWPGTCRKLSLTLRDGTKHEALFHFVK